MGFCYVDGVNNLIRIENLMYVVLIFMTFKRFLRLYIRLLLIQKNDSTQTQPSVCQLLLL